MDKIYCSKELIDQFLESFSELDCVNVEVSFCFPEFDIIFNFKKNKRKIIFSIWDLDYIEVSICKPRLFFIPDPIYYKYNKYRFNLHDILEYFPNNSLIQFVNYKYYSKNQKELLGILMNRKPFAKNEEEYVFKNTVKEHILFLKENLLPIINGEMWIDELLKQKKKSKPITDI